MMPARALSESLVILPLRTAEGVPLESLPDRALDLARGERDGWWRVRRGRLRLTARPEGIWLELLKSRGGRPFESLLTDLLHA